MNGFLFFPFFFVKKCIFFLSDKCSTEHGKLCFEALEIKIVPQNHLLKKAPQSLFSFFK